MDVVLGVAVAGSTARIAMIEGAEAHGAVIDEAVLELPASAEAGASGFADVIDAVLSTRRSLTENGHQLVSTGVCTADDSTTAALRAALGTEGVEDVAVVTAAQATAALEKGAGLPVTAEGKPDFALARGAALAAPGALAAAASPAPPTIVLRSLAKEAAAPNVATQMAPVTSGELPPNAPTQMSPSAATQMSPSAATQMAPATVPGAEAPEYEPQLAYSMTGSQSAVSDYSPLDDSYPYLEDTGTGAVPKQRKPFVLVGSVAAGLVVIALAVLATTVVIGIKPTSDQTHVVPSAPSSPPPETIPAPVQAGNVEVPAPPSVVVPPAPVQSVENVPAPVRVPASAPKPAYSGGGSAPAPVVVPTQEVLPPPPPPEVIPEPAPVPVAPILPLPRPRLRDFLPPVIIQVPGGPGKHATSPGDTGDTPPAGGGGTVGTPQGGTAGTQGGGTAGTAGTQGGGGGTAGSQGSSGDGQKSAGTQGGTTLCPNGAATC